MKRILKKQHKRGTPHRRKVREMKLKLLAPIFFDFNVFKRFDQVKPKDPRLETPMYFLFAEDGHAQVYYTLEFATRDLHPVTLEPLDTE